MTEVVSIRFKNRGKAYYFDPAGLRIQVGDSVIVDTANGMEIAVCSRENHPVEDTAVVQPLRRVLRIATQMDLRTEELNRQREKTAFDICREKIQEHNLDMKLVDVECNFEGSKTTFFFTSDGRVDFRSLVKDLAGILHNRIELRQIGVRDEAKMLGGLGPCGRPICCGSFLDQFQPVSIKMAKEQNLSLNPTKISGVCGRLMCCLKYEQEHYEMTRKKMPKIGREVITPDGTGPVTDLNIVKETVFVRLTNGDTSEIKEYPLENITKPSDGNTNQEQGKKNNGEEKTEPVYEGFAGKKAQNVSTEKSEDSDADEKMNLTETDISINSEEKNNRKARKPILGQPVRRENPNRQHEKKDGEEVQAQPDHNVAKETQATSETSPRSPWADALQKAMQAISQDK